MASTPTRLKAVTFRLPGSNSSSPRTSTLAQPTITQGSNVNDPSPKSPSPLTVQGTSAPKLNEPKPGPLASDSTPTAQHGAKPDLVADIIERPKTVHQKKLTNQDNVHTTRPESRPGSDVRAILQKQDKQTSSNARKIHLGGRVYSRSGSRTFANTTYTRDRSPLLDQQRYKTSAMSSAQVAQVASQIRDSTNSSSHEHRLSLIHI